MAKVTGRNGVIRMGETPVAIAQLKSWSFNETAEEINVTAFNEGGKDFLAGEIDRSGDFSFWIDPGSAQHDSIVAGAEVELQLYPTGTGTGAKYREFTAIILSRSESATAEGGGLEAACTFKVRGAVQNQTVS